MKKIIILTVLFFGLALQCFAVDVMPDRVSLIRNNTLGVYQVSSPVKLYEQPDINSPVKEIIEYCPEKLSPVSLAFQDVFVVYKAQKNLALMAVTDETEDWVQVIYDNVKGSTGWIPKDDPYKFSSWVNFYNVYGKKYGLYMLKGTPESIKNIHGSPDDTSKIISIINYPLKMNLNVIRGNWVLLSIMDVDKIPKTGFVRWRSDEGVKYLFPAIK